jgi:hypothetical protein
MCVMIRWLALLLAIAVLGAPTIAVTEPARICKAVCKKAAAGSKMSEKEKGRWKNCVCDEDPDKGDEWRLPDRSNRRTVQTERQ